MEARNENIQLKLTREQLETESLGYRDSYNQDESHDPTDCNNVPPEENIEKMFNPPT